MLGRAGPGWAWLSLGKLHGIVAGGAALAPARRLSSNQNTRACLAGGTSTPASGCPWSITRWVAILQCGSSVVAI